MPVTTPIHYGIKQYLDDQYARLERDKITHWLMRFSAGLPTDVDDCRGGRIRRGPEVFQGQVRDMYWSFIRPCLQDIIADAFMRANSIGQPLGHKTARAGFDETSMLLRGFVTRIYQRMVEIDRALRGKGYPQSVPAYDPTALIGSLHAEIDMQSASWKDQYPGWLQRWWLSVRENPFHLLKTIALPAIAVTIIGGVAAGVILHWMGL